MFSARVSPALFAAVILVILLVSVGTDVAYAERDVFSPVGWGWGSQASTYVRPSSGCMKDKDCEKMYGPGYVCVNGQCVRSGCTSDWECQQAYGSGYRCVNGQCVYGQPSCPEGASQVLEYCSDAKTWRIRQICVFGSWVVEYQACPRCSPEGSTQVLKMCPDNVNVMEENVCQNGVWVLSKYSCPQCSPEGSTQVLQMCPDGANVALQNVCKNGVWVPEAKVCPLCYPEGKVEVVEKCPDGTPKVSRTCQNGLWIPETEDCPTPTAQPETCEPCEKVGVHGCSEYCEAEIGNYCGVWKDCQLVEGKLCYVKSGEGCTPDGCSGEGEICKVWCGIQLYPGSPKCESGKKCEDGKIVEFTRNCLLPGDCFIATAAYGSGSSVEVAYMRYVRDHQIGSTPTGRVVVDWWNSFYYLWSPPIAQAIAPNPTLQAIFRVLLLPLVGTIHVTDAVFTALGGGDLASVAAFAVAAVMSTAIYILPPALAVGTAWRCWKRRRRDL